MYREVSFLQLIGVDEQFSNEASAARAPRDTRLWDMCAGTFFQAGRCATPREWQRIFAERSEGQGYLAPRAKTNVVVYVTGLGDPCLSL